MLAALGRRALSFTVPIVDAVTLAALALGSVLDRSPTGRRAVRDQCARQIVFTGNHAAPLISFLAVLTGISVMVSLDVLFPGASNEQNIVKLLTYVFVRELGPLTTAVVIILRSCAAVTVELGYMRARGEIDSMETLGIDPVRFVLLPRFVGIVVASVGLTMLFIVVAYAVGLAVGVGLGLAPSSASVVERAVANIHAFDVLIALGKSVAFGMIIATTACYFGLSVPRDLTKIPPAVTRAVVTALTWCVLVAVAVTVGAA